MTVRSHAGSATHLLVVTLLLGAFASHAAHSAQFVDPFDSWVGVQDREPFTWLGASYDVRTGSTWTGADGVLEYRPDGDRGIPLEVSLPQMGIDLSDGQWTLETAFRHVEGAAPRAAYETIAYLRWPADEPGLMHIVALMYDASQRALVVYNASGDEEPVPADFTGDFRTLRMAVARGLLRVWIDGELVAGPVRLKTRRYGGGQQLLVGPITAGEDISLRCQWDYIAMTTDGAFAPGGTWPGSVDAPVAEGLITVEGLGETPPYEGITVLRREKGGESWDEALPDLWRRLSAQISEEPRQIEAPFYDYEDAGGPVTQNVYPDAQALRYDDRRGVGIAMLTRGVGDTATGYVDYKVWYRVTTDGGQTWTDLKPLVDEREGFTPAHPNPYVWIGRNGFCYASIPPLLKLSNGEILLPFYYAPIDEAGNYYNPLNAYTFGYVACAIGRWNEAGDDIIWTTGEPVEISERKSARGFSEAAVIELSQPGHVLMVLRGSNAPDPWGDMPAVKWRSLSTDYGRTWSDPEVFTYADSERFMSPSACSAFTRSSETGKVYWIGNIARTLPQGNAPRYPLIIAELDEETLGLRRETVTIIDDRGPDDPPELQLSNFKVLEDPHDGHILVYLSRYMAEGHRDSPGYGAHTYVIDVK